jgi:hypothetical protein
LTWSLGSEHGAGGADQALAQRLVAIGPPLNLGDWFSNGLARALGRRLSGKKSARGAALSTSQSLLRVEHHGLRDRQMAVIESWSEAKD